MSTLKLLGDSSGYVQLVANTAAQNNTLTLPNVNDTLANITSPTFLSNIALAGTGTAPSIGMFTPSANTLAFATNTTQVVTITSTGNLGIGTSTVSAGNAVAVYGGNLYVNGNITFGSTTLSATGITQQIFTFGTGTYTTPTGVKWIRVRMIGGGGGGGGGSGTAQNGGGGGNGGTTTFGSSFLTANGGGAGGGSGQGGGTGGTATGGDINIQGTGGIASQGNSVGNVNYPFGGTGAASPFGGGGNGGAPTNSGGGPAAYGVGGGGGGGAASTGQGGAAGAAGGYLEKIINNPATTYAYQVGSGGTAGAAGTGGAGGGTGGGGIIIIEEHYNW
jgi:hypothetical protein